MADTNEKKVEKKIKEPAPKAPEHGHEHANKAPGHTHEAPAHRPAEHKEAAPARKTSDQADKQTHPVRKVEAKPPAKAEPPAPKAEPKPVQKAEEKPPAKTEAPKKEAPAEGPAPVAEEKAPEPTSEGSPTGESGEVEGEPVEEPERKTAGKPKKKKGKKERRPAIKPKLSPEVVKAMELRRALKDKTPNFIRQDAYNYGRLSRNWRRPRGTHSKLRHHIKYRINVVSIGYGGPNASKGLHPSGFREVLVHHPLELDKVDPATQAARIAGGVGYRKRMMIQQRAQRKGIRVLNEMQE